MKKILFVSNSFGVDSTRYFYGVSRAVGKKVKVATLYIGGCSLYRHYRNMLSGEKAYAYYINGMESGLMVSLKEALLSDEWDVIVTQQCSPDSGNLDSYFPFLPELAAFFRQCAPKAELHIQRTWSFAEGCPRFGKTDFETREEMIPAVREAYRKAAEAVSADGIIPAMDVMNKLYDAVGDATYRDGFHASFGLGRYALACLWLRYFFGKSPSGNTFRDFDVEVTEDEVLLAQRIVDEVMECNG
ncbi:MAG: DUF4886 domain-containing protein [Clostridia bacterium]|nr:DUF4886 domain-containing protein [Clostridia bacterium]MBQ4323187.1 DUF4886 domain-containing protein [Clostridia bacterium]